MAFTNIDTILIECSGEMDLSGGRLDMPRGVFKRKHVPPNKTEWTLEMEKFLRDNYETMTNRQLASALGLTLTVTRTKLYAMGFKRMELEYWTEEQVDLLIKLYPFVGDVEIADYFSALFPKKKGWTEKHIDKKRRVYLKLLRTPEQIKDIKRRNVDLGSGYKSNLKRWDGRVTRVGRIKVINRNGRLIPVIKTDDGFVDLHRFNYENEFGPIPEDHCIVRKDETILDYSPSNLECVTWQEMCKRNFDKNDNWYAAILARGDKELKEELLKHPEIIKLHRLNSTLRKEIKNAVRKKIG